MSANAEPTDSADHVYGDLKPFTRCWRAVVALPMIPVLAGLTALIQTSDGTVAQLVTWAIEPFRKPDPAELAARGRISQD